MSAGDFASEVLVELRIVKPDVGTLVVDVQKDRAAIGLQVGNRVQPIFGLAAPTPKYNKMRLHVWENDDWKNTFFKGTPKMLAEFLCESYTSLLEEPEAHPASGVGTD